MKLFNLIFIFILAISFINASEVTNVEFNFSEIPSYDNEFLLNVFTYNAIGNLTDLQSINISLPEEVEYFRGEITRKGVGQYIFPYTIYSSEQDSINFSVSIKTDGKEINYVFLSEVRDEFSIVEGDGFFNRFNKSLFYVSQNWEYCLFISLIIIIIISLWWVLHTKD